MSIINRTKNVCMEAGKPLKKCAKYKGSSKQRKLLQQDIKWQRWGKYIYWPSENDQMELPLKFKQKVDPKNEKKSDPFSQS